MQRVYHTKREVSLRVDCTFFEGSGWVPDKPFYVGKFTPGNGWACKARGEIFIHFEVDELRTKCILSTLVKHNLQLVDDDGTDDSDASESSVYRCRHVSTPLARVFVDSSDEDVPVRSLYPPRCDVDSPPEVELVPGRNLQLEMELMEQGASEDRAVEIATVPEPKRQPKRAAARAAASAILDSDAEVRQPKPYP